VKYLVNYKNFYKKVKDI